MQAGDLARVIYRRAGLGDVHRVRRIETGFSNYVFDVDGEYVLKFGKSEEDEGPLLREVFLCGLLREKVPAPAIVHSGTWDALVGRVFIVYEKIEGDTLYTRWHLLDDGTRREMVRSICAMLRAVNEAPYQDFAREFGIDTGQSWQERRCAAIEDALARVEERGDLDPATALRVRKCVERHEGALQEQKMALTYYDVHFDNFIVSGREIVGMLDFERTDVASVDYVLNTVRRMALHPHKFASEAAERFVRPEDYAHLMEWFEEFYPEAFAFRDLDRRLDLYALEHSLGDIFYYPEGQDARNELAWCLDRLA